MVMVMFSILLFPRIQFSKGKKNRRKWVYGSITLFYLLLFVRCRRKLDLLNIFDVLGIFLFYIIYRHVPQCVSQNTIKVR